MNVLKIDLEQGITTPGSERGSDLGGFRPAEDYLNENDRRSSMIGSMREQRRLSREISRGLQAMADAPSPDMIEEMARRESRGNHDGEPDAEQQPPTHSAPGVQAHFGHLPNSSGVRFTVPVVCLPQLHYNQKQQMAPMSSSERVARLAQTTEYLRTHRRSDATCREQNNSTTPCAAPKRPDLPFPRSIFGAINHKQNEGSLAPKTSPDSHSSAQSGHDQFGEDPTSPLCDDSHQTRNREESASMARLVPPKTVTAKYNTDSEVPSATYHGQGISVPIPREYSRRISADRIDFERDDRERQGHGRKISY